MRQIFVIVLASLPFATIAACSASDENPAAADPGAPTAPSGLSASQMGTGIHLVWKDNSSDEAEFQIERRETGGPYARIASVAFDVAQLHDTGLVAAKMYTYRVRAVSSGGARSAFSNETTMEAPSGAGNGTPDAGPPVTWDGGAVSFQEHIVPFFQKSCGAGDSLCHARDGYGANSSEACRGWLTLENASLGSQFYGGTRKGQSTGCPDKTLYQRLTQLDAWQEPNGQLRKYVTPNNPGQSYLYNKIAGGPFGDDRPGVPSAAMPPSPRAISATDVAMVKKWIETGAPSQ